MTRPVQLGLIDGVGDKAVGPMLTSVVQRRSNADLIALVAPLYLTASVLDVTYGRGMWWQRYRPAHLTFHDLALDGVDFRSLPHPDKSFDAVCFDPPYVPRQGGSDATLQRDQDYRERFGLAESRSGAELKQLIADGIAECARVSRSWVLAKCTDFVNGKQFHLGHLQLIQAAEAAGLRCHDLIVHASGTGPGGGQILTPIRARRAHSYLCVFSRAGRTRRALTKPERLVLQRLAEGRTSVQIARELGVGSTRIANRLVQIRSYYGAATTPQLIAMAVRAGDIA